MPPETVCPTDYKQSKESNWRRIMYCRVNPYAKGLTSSECTKMGGLPEGLISETADMQSSDDELTYRLANPDPTNLSNLSNDDLATVREIIIAKTDVELLNGAVIALGENGSLSDAFILISFLEDGSVGGTDAVIAKIAVPPALYKIASRLDKDNAAIIIAQALTYADPERAQQLVGNQSESLRVQAIVGLGEAKGNAVLIIDAFIKKGQGEVADMEAALPGTDEAIIGRLDASGTLDADLLGVARSIAISPQQ